MIKKKGKRRNGAFRFSMKLENHILMISGGAVSRHEKSITGRSRRISVEAKGKVDDV